MVAPVDDVHSNSLEPSPTRCSGNRARREHETCTLWDNTYELSPTSTGGYRIFDLLHFTDSPC